jgi:hypothetical protein
LYIDPRGPYPKLLGSENCWDSERDARLYEGDDPVIAHPPCGPWGSLRHLSKATPAEKMLAPLAVSQVRRCGGVLEHPARSRLFFELDLPKPGDPPDRFGGRTIEVEQVRWGHPARKKTWLYMVGVKDLGVMPEPREPTHWISGFRPSAARNIYKNNGSAVPEGIKVCSAQQRRRTPVAFAQWLIWLAEQASF